MFGPLLFLRYLFDDVARRTLVLGGSHVIGAALGFGITVIAVRALGDAGFSSVAIALSLQGYAFATLSFGLDHYAIPQAARDRDKLASLLSLTILIKLCLAVLTMIALLGLAFSGLFNPEISLAIAIVCPSLLFFALFPLWTFVAVERTGFVAAVLLGGQVVHTGFVLLAFALETPGWGFVLAKVGSDLAMTAVSLVCAVRLAGPLDLKGAIGGLAHHFRAAAPLAGSQFLRSTIISLDIAVLGLFVVASEVGQYAVAYRIYLFVITLGSRYFLIVLPEFSRQSSEGAVLLRATLHKAMWRSLPVLGLGLVVLAAFSETILNILFGAEFSAIALELRILLAACLLNFLHLTYRQVLLAAGSLKLELTSYSFGAVTKVIALFTLCYGFGATGAALAVLVGDAVIVVLQQRAANKVMTGTVR